VRGKNVAGILHVSRDGTRIVDYSILVVDNACVGVPTNVFPHLTEQWRLPRPYSLAPAPRIRFGHFAFRDWVPFAGGGVAARLSLEVWFTGPRTLRGWLWDWDRRPWFCKDDADRLIGLAVRRIPDRFLTEGG
jgi:hypothetical protein